MGPRPGGTGPCGPHCGRRLPSLSLPVGPPRVRLVLAVLPMLLLLLLASRPAPAAAKPIALASPDQVLENMRQIPQWHCLRYRKFDLVTQHKRCRHFRADRKH